MRARRTAECAPCVLAGAGGIDAERFVGVTVAGGATLDDVVRITVFVKDNGQREIEVELSERYRISPEIAAALRSAPGVIDVEVV